MTHSREKWAIGKLDAKNDVQTRNFSQTAIEDAPHWPFWWLSAVAIAVVVTSSPLMDEGGGGMNMWKGEWSERR